MHFDYMTQGTCSQIISFEIEDGVVRDLQFFGGCNGNLQAVSRLVDGWTADRIEAKLTGILCGPRKTSCADQLAKAVRAAYNAEQEQKAAAQA